jgi:PAS domain S-box-containing protein
MQSPQPVAASDLTGRLLVFNRAFLDLTGYAPDELKRKGNRDLTPAKWKDLEDQMVQQLLKTGKPVTFEKECQRKNGSMVPIEVKMDVYRGEDDVPLCVFAFINDITEKKKVHQECDALLLREQQARAQAEAAERRSNFLAEASSLLILSLDYESILQRLAEIAVPSLADICIIWMLSENRQLRLLALTHADPEKMKLAQEVIQRYLPTERRNEGVMNVVTTGRSMLVREVADDLLRQVAQSEEHLELLRQGQLKSYICVPLTARNHPVGAMSFFTAESARTYSREDLLFAEELASRAALIIDNAMLFGKLKRSLDEKELLLQELHHRVKNNLQVISSLLSLQAGKFDNPELVAAFEEGRSRVRTMALIHEKLYGSGDLAHIIFGDYLESLAKYLSQSYYMNPSQRIGFNVKAGEYRLDINKAVPLGLIANELISNSFKHAFPQGTGQISINLDITKDAVAVLTISDNGIGLPRDVTLENPRSLGLKLVNLLVKQIDGEVQVDDSGQGTTYRISFPYEPTKVAS